MALITSGCVKWPQSPRVAQGWQMDPLAAFKAAILSRGSGGGRQLHAAFKRCVLEPPGGCS